MAISCEYSPLKATMAAWVVKIVFLYNTKLRRAGKYVLWCSRHLGSGPGRTMYVVRQAVCRQDRSWCFVTWGTVSRCVCQDQRITGIVAVKIRKSAPVAVNCGPYR
ncbi:unnamed protein product, partial [Pylaiella littoralis]